MRMPTINKIDSIINKPDVEENGEMAPINKAPYGERTLPRLFAI